jgi:hypothetical protein
MRALKTLLIIVGVVLVLVLILGMIGADTYRFERTVTIAAPAEQVHGHIATFAAMDKWSPWNEHDPNMKKTTEGTDGTIGAVWKWEGNDDVGKGQQRLDSLTPTLIQTHLHFLEPF